MRTTTCEVFIIPQADQEGQAAGDACATEFSGVANRARIWAVSPDAAGRAGRSRRLVRSWLSFDSFVPSGSGRGRGEV